MRRSTRKGLRPLVLGVLALAAACSIGDPANPRTDGLVTGPSFVDEHPGDCPTCRALTPVEKRRLLAAIIQLQNDCPPSGNAALNLYNRNHYYVNSDTTNWGDTWYDFGGYPESPYTYTSLHPSLLSTVTASSDLYYTLRHEAQHYRQGPIVGGEFYALQAEVLCLF